MADTGKIRVQCFVGQDYIPIDKCRITIEGEGDFATNTVYDMTTGSTGETQEIEVEAPPLEYSLDQNINKTPYSTYNLTIERDGFDPIKINGCQVFPGQVAYQVCRMKENTTRAENPEEITIQANTLNGDFPSKIPEEDEKPLPPPTSGVVLAQPVVPEYIVVHAGGPNNNSAPNYKVLYKDYIKNVASSEIYSTWPDATIRANVFCIISFTLNRIYTEWYRSKGKNFQITNSTAYDHAFNYGRNIYDSISRIVDEIFSTYIKRFGRKQPLLTQYCDGKNVKCPQWLSQWGSKDLGDQGKVPYEILTYYYGNDIELSTADKVLGIPSSYPGYDLTKGSTGEPVRTVQSQLNAVSKNYPLIPKLKVDGDYGENTANSVKVFQEVFNLPKTGVVDYATWYKLSEIYVGVTKIAELRNITASNVFIPPTMPNIGDKRDVPKIYY